MNRIVSIILLFLVAAWAALPVHAQNASKETVTISDIETGIRGYKKFTICNNSDEEIDVHIVVGGKEPLIGSLLGGQTSTFNNNKIKIKGDIVIKPQKSSQFVLRRWAEVNKQAQATADEKTEPAPANPVPEPAVEKKEPQDKQAAQRDTGREEPETKLRISQNLLMEYFEQWLANQAYYNADSLAAWQATINPMIESLSYMKDEMKDDYVIRHNIQQLILDNTNRLQQHVDGRDTAIEEFLLDYAQYEIADAAKCRELMAQRMDEVHGQYDDTLQTLADAAKIKRKRVTGNSGDWLMTVILAGLLLALALAAYFIRRRNASGAPTGSAAPPVARPAAGPSATDGNIVVRRRTTSVLKRQFIDDVRGNNSYLHINVADFCDDSAVNNIYIKNTCIKDIYNMYAEDLRNPDNPKEDGCMVLGRWVQDDTGSYDVTLEQIVLPGDDAVFAEYELNFGGKIKLRVHERLKRLRLETGLQYDLTCWVHSHPGLGVFFSNADNSVHLLHKHPTHPFFLTAMVVDILTPDQTLGIFTFKRDGSINAKADLTRMYSLEEMYQWAVESERASFNPGDYFNALKGCAARYPHCRGIELSNSAIIDMTQIVMRPAGGLAGYAHGFVRKQGEMTESVVASIDADMNIGDRELLGAIIVDTHCSLPSVRRATAHLLDRLQFVLVYASTTGVVTALPVVHGELCDDVNYYGENKLEDLKIWTRRKR